MNHPNIAQIYGIEDRALVMELVPGESLKGPLPLETALNYAKQIADALEAAHEKNIIHRDLKPANIMITPAGVVKVLDFGLAAVSQSSDPSDPVNSPTRTISPTRAGMILGTPAYMSPEQARGKPVDKRADIWAFGVVLFEMLTGKRLFEGETVSDTLAHVLTKEPDWEQVPAKVRKLLEACLQKDPKQRLQAIGDWRLLVANEQPPIVAPSRSRFRWVSAALAVVSIALGAVLWRSTRPVEHPLTRLNVDLGSEALAGLNTTVVISADGRRLVFPARGPNGRQQLATRQFDQTQPTLLPGTEGGLDPFFSPDGQWIGFFANSQLKKISVQGGTPVVLCPAPNPLGATWGPDDNIVASLVTFAPLSIVPAAGGAPKQLTRLVSGESTHRWPQFLPKSQVVVFTASADNFGQESASIEAVSLKTGRASVLLRGGYFGRYLPSGQLVYVHQGALFGVGFDPVRLQVHGGPIPLIGDLAANPISGGGQFDFSESGTFLYTAGKSAAQSWQVSWLDRSGKLQPLISAPGAYTLPRLSPDGSKLAFSNSSDLYLHDLKRDTTIRLTFTGDAQTPVWGPDGGHILFVGNGTSFFWIRSDGAGEPIRLFESRNSVAPWSFSPDGHWLAYRETNPETRQDLWTLPLDVGDLDHPKPGTPELFLRTATEENLPRFSPDGHWIAYRSDESGSSEIYVRPFPKGNGGKWQISTGGGLYALWSNKGHELFYETPDNRVMVVDYTVDGSSFMPGRPRSWSDKQLFYGGASNLDLAPDGKRFAVLAQPESTSGQGGSVHVTMLLNFFDEAKRRLAQALP